MTFIRRSAAAFLALDVIFLLVSFLMLAFRGETVDAAMIIMAVALPLVMIAVYNIANGLFKHVDRIVLVSVLILSSIGLIMQFRINWDTGIKQFIWFITGIVIMFIVAAIFKGEHSFEKINWVFIIAAVALLAAAFLFAKVTGGAKNWIKIGPLTFQPSEFAKVAFIISMAYFFANNPELKPIILFSIFSVACVLILVMSTDLGAAVLFAITFVIVFYISTGSKLLTAAGIGAMGAGAVASYYLFSHVRVRVQIWQDPWALYYGKGYQIVQGLMAIASGSLFGMGLGMGTPSAIPAYNTDFIFAVICEEFGIIFGVFLIMLYLVFILRGALIALNARSKSEQLLAFGCTAMLSVQCFIIIAGVIKMIPLTGITLPFVSYGGSSMWSCMMLVGIIEGIAVKNGIKDTREIRSVGGDVI